MRKLLACGAALAALLVSSAPALARQFGEENVIRDAGLAELDASIAWIDYVLGRVDAGDLLLFNMRASMLVGADHETLVPINRDDAIQAIRLEVSDGRLTSQKGAEILLSMARDTATYRASLRGQRERLSARRDQMRGALSRLPQRPLQPWELGRPPQQPPPWTPGPAVGPSVAQVFSAVPTQSSDRFRGDTVGELAVETNIWDRTPYRVTGDFVGTVTAGYGQRVLLAGDPAATTGWQVDNFLYVEIDGRGYVAGQDDAVSENGEPLRNLGEGVLDLTGFFKPGVATTVRIMALDYGGVGGVSDVYLVVR